MKTPEGRVATLDGFIRSVEEQGATFDDLRKLLPEYSQLEANTRAKLAERGLSEEEIDARAKRFITEEVLGRTAEKVLNKEDLSVDERNLWRKVLDWLKGVHGVRQGGAGERSKHYGGPAGEGACGVVEGRAGGCC
ncbi:MAG: hypothetical protein ACFCU1_09420 [Sumerlaeia bacterium]